MSEETKVKKEKKVNKENTKKEQVKFQKKETKPTINRGISIKNWIFIVITIVIAFGAGFYFSYITSQVKIQEYKYQIEKYQERQKAIEDVMKIYK